MKFEDVEKLMKARNMKMSDLARAAGVPYSTLTDWKAGRYTPKFDKQKKIADFFGVELKPETVYTIDTTGLRGAMNKVYDMAAPGLSRVIDLYCLFDEQDRKEVLGLMEIKYEMYKDEEGDDNANR